MSADIHVKLHASSSSCLDSVAIQSHGYGMTQRFEILRGYVGFGENALNLVLKCYHSWYFLSHEMLLFPQNQVLKDSVQNLLLSTIEFIGYGMTFFGYGMTPVNLLMKNCLQRYTNQNLTPFQSPSKEFKHKEQTKSIWDRFSHASKCCM